MRNQLRAWLCTWKTSKRQLPDAVPAEALLAFVVRSTERQV